MKNLKAKLQNKGGFTLIEMLIVVAIIAILIAISIPLVGSALERAREATDAANERAFKAQLTVSYLNHEAKMEATGVTFSTNTVYKYDAVNGTLKGESDAVSGYGQSTATMGVDNVERKGQVLWGLINDKGEVKMVWGSTKPANMDDNNCISSKMVTG